MLRARLAGILSLSLIALACCDAPDSEETRLTPETALQQLGELVPQMQARVDEVRAMVAKDSWFPGEVRGDSIPRHQRCSSNSGRCATPILPWTNRIQAYSAQGFA